MPDLSWPKQRKLLRAPNIGFNAEVYRYFRDVDDNNPQASVSRKALRDSLLIGAKDSRTTAITKIQYFRDQVQKVHIKPTIVGELKANVDERMIYKCQVELYFQQDRDAVPSDFTPIDARISFRLSETSETITEAKYRAIANKIKTEFTATNGYVWDKGKYLCWYEDRGKGYHFQIYALNESEGEKIIKKVMAIQDHTFDEKLFRVTEPKRASDNTPANQTILGKTYKKPRWRPTGRVRFLWAELMVHGLPNPITLVDRTGTRYRPVILAT